MWAVLPVRGFAQSKRRLGNALKDVERAALSQAMMCDVLRALNASAGLEGILVVSADPAALAVAADFGARAEPDPGPGGYNGAVVRAAALLAAEGVDGMLQLPGDVPLVTVAELRSVLAAHGAAPAMTLVADRAGSGTNCLALSPPDLVAPAFGPGSFARHRATGAARGIAVRSVQCAGLALDIDLPDDLRLVMQRPGETETQRYLRGIGLETRLAQEQQG